MILAVKGFEKDLVAVHGNGRYLYHPGKNITTDAKCAAAGFHCCEDPIECLTYYKWNEKNEFRIVWAGGDIDEDSGNRISCTELTIGKRLTEPEFLLLHANYLFNHGDIRLSEYRCSPFQVVYNTEKTVSGKLGDWLCIIGLKKKKNICVAQQVDGIRFLPDVEYTLGELESAA